MGSAIARVLAAQTTLTLWSREHRHAVALAQEVESEVRRARVRVAAGFAGFDAVDTLILCVHDAAIKEVADRIAAALAALGSRRRGAVVLHTSGFHDEAPLAALKQRGWSTGSLHPLISLAAGAQDAKQLSRAWFAIGPTSLE